MDTDCLLSAFFSSPLELYSVAISTKSEEKFMILWKIVKREFVRPLQKIKSNQRRGIVLEINFIWQYILSLNDA